MDILSIAIVIVAAMICLTETKCGPAEYKNKADECCPMCGKGYVVYKDCTEMSSTSCIPCVGQTYMSEPNGLNSCFPCHVCDSNEGLHVQQKCTTSSNAVCAVLPGYYCESSTEDGGCRFGVKHSVCSPGQGIQTPGTERTDTVCEECKEGHFSIDGIICKAHTNCAVRGEELEENGSLTKDNKCRKPHRHRYGLIVAFALFLPLLFVHAIYLKTIKQTVTETDTARSSYKVPVQETHSPEERKSTRNAQPVEDEDHVTEIP